MIKVSIIAASISSITGQKIVTYCLEYPRFIHLELMTHRLFSRNAASSRAIPINKMLEMVANDPAMPVEWGLDNPGMQSKALHPNPDRCIEAWKRGAARAIITAEEHQALGLHKQIVNRHLENYVWMKTVVTATEYDNFFWLRTHKDAQPELQALAEEMYQQYQTVVPIELKPGEWHVPYYKGNYGDGVWKPCGYVRGGVDSSGNQTIENVDCRRKGHTLKEAQKISSSCCAQVSYRVLDEGLSKAESIYDKLVSSIPVHASPFEHAATPMLHPKHERYPEMAIEYDAWDKGETHVDKYGDAWSGNLKGFIQYRQLIPQHVCNEYIREDS